MYKIEECYHNYQDYMFFQMLIPSPAQLLQKHKLIKPKVLQERNLNRKLSEKDVSDDEIDEILDFTKELSTLLEEYINSINNNQKFKQHYNEAAKSLYKCFTVINN